MSLTTINYDLFFEKNKFIWSMKPVSFRDKKNKVGKSNITFYKFNDKYYAIVTIEKVFFSKLKLILQSKNMANYYKDIREITILDKQDIIVGNNFFFEKNFLLPEEKKYYYTMRYIKNKYNINGYRIPEEIWLIIEKYLPSPQKNICVYFDDNIDYCEPTRLYHFYLYGINVDDKKNFFAIPYWHSKTEARKAIAKYLNKNNSNVGLFLYKRGNLYHDQNGYFISFFSFVRLFIFKETKIHFINTNGNSIYSNKILKYGKKKYKISKIVYN